MADLNIDINDKENNNNKEEIINPCRCPECYLIPLITIYEEKNKLKLKFKCQNNHEFNEDYDSLYKKSKFDNIECKKCNIKKLKNKFYICSVCYNFYCKKCKNEHKKENNNHLCININKYDSRCKIHNKDLVGYCEKHCKNYCDYCPKYYHEFNRNKLIYEKEMNEYLEKINNYENKIKNNNQELNSLVDKIENLLKTIKNMIKTSQINQSIEINFQKEIINTYNFMKEQKNLNYQIIQNVRNIMNLPINLELNKNIINIIKKNNILYDNFSNEIKNELGIIKEVDKFKDFNIENTNIIRTLYNNKESIYCLKILDDGRLAGGDSNSNLIIYNKDTFNPDITIQNNLGCLWNFIQLKNKNIACSFNIDYTLKIIKIKNKKDYEIIQIIKNSHTKNIRNIIELKNENLITFSKDCSFKIWNLNNDNKYETLTVFNENNELSDGYEIKDNEEILYTLNSNPQSLVFYNLYKSKKIRTLNNLNLCINIGCRTSKLNNDELVVAGYKKVYLIDIKNYLILNQIDSNKCNYSILKLSNNLFLIGDENGTINQYRIQNKNIIKESSKNNSHEGCIWTMIIFNDFIISGGSNRDINIWKK